MRTKTIIYEYSNVDTYVSASDEYFTLSDQSGAECWEDLDEGSCLPISYHIGLNIPFNIESQYWVQYQDSISGSILGSISVLDVAMNL